LSYIFKRVLRCKKNKKMSIDKKTFQFLKDLKKNNNRDWFAENKPDFTKAQSYLEYIEMFVFLKIKHRINLILQVLSQGKEKN